MPSELVSALLLPVLLSAALGQAWAIAERSAGVTSLGHAVFFGTGAYATAILQTRWGLSPWLGPPIGAGLGALGGWGIGLALGGRGRDAALVTLGLGLAFRTLAETLDLTRGGLGILLPARSGLADQRLVLGAAVALLALATVSAGRLPPALPGTVRPTVLAWSGALAALAGVLFAQVALAVDPVTAFGLERSVEMVAVAILGGTGTVLGPLLGAVLLHLVIGGARLLVDAPYVGPIALGLVLLLGLWRPGGFGRLLRRA